jgi:hypothetical protein
MTPEQALHELEKEPEQPRCSYCSRFMAWDSKPVRAKGAPPQPTDCNDPWNWVHCCSRCSATTSLTEEPE